MSGSGIYAVLKLTDRNWVEFKTKTVMSLTARGLNRHLTGTVKVPKPLKLSTDGKKILLDNGKEALAIQQLYATVPNSVMIQVQNKGSVAEIWKAFA
ncbi:hypothetical protein DFH29DRAFT_1004338 [Suillus ampliporus]|nr:hypothetical protein DFH29DRAFT_1004338 [Suillus ampliporus]